MNGEIPVRATESGNEMIFECSDGPFCSIAAMEVRRDQLKINIFTGEKLL